jgi:hypothetical protein
MFHIIKIECPLICSNSIGRQLYQAENGVLAFENGVLAFENGVLTFEKVVLAFENEVLAFEKGVLGLLAFENGI